MKMLSLNRKGKDLVNVNNETKNQSQENDGIKPNIWRASKPCQQNLTKTKSQGQKIQQQSHSIK